MLNKITLSDENSKKFISNSLIFLAPLILIYLMQVQAVLSSENHLFVLSDLIPTQITFGAMMLYSINVMVDYFKKLKR